ncbi:MAG TPA: ribbon-helix-helix domain-containing protein [Methanomassiliicoccales archaeon]|nr:ribbon-helix-helix domain-containing protein [Methanomassiliicoccales archaeon]
MQEESNEHRTSIVDVYHKKKESIIINARVPQGIVAKIDDLVQKELYRSRSEFMVAALRNYLEGIEERENNRPVNIPR